MVLQLQELQEEEHIVRVMEIMNQADQVEKDN
jgi:hypothetical protein